MSSDHRDCAADLGDAEGVHNESRMIIEACLASTCLKLSQRSTFC